MSRETHSSPERSTSSGRAIKRRSVLRAAAAATLGTTAASRIGAGADPPPPAADYRVTHGRIRQSVMGWCFDPMPAMELAQHCKAMGLTAIEGIDTQFYPQIKELGLDVSLVSSHGFRRGMCDRDYHAECVRILTERIELAARHGFKNVITFTGYLPAGVKPEQATKNCIDGWKKIIRFAEEKQVNLCLEHLNTRDDSHPMKGHPGYFGDDVDHCIDIIRAVDSPRMKLLFDIYHVQIMNGDVIRRIRTYHSYIGHYHTAGVPGRGELDENQEIQYAAVMRAIAETGYQGYVAQEFIPTWQDKVAALRHAVQVCDIA
jgi:hydroxypyruvate isomerase